MVFGHLLKEIISVIMMNKRATYHDRRSVPFFHGGGMTFEGKHYSHMFQEDFNLSDFDLLSSTKARQIAVIFDGEQKAIDLAKNFLQSIGRDTNYGRRDPLFSAAHKIGSTIMRQGYAYFELCIDKENDGVLAHSFTNSHLTSLPLYYVQKPPPDNQWGKEGSIWLRKNNVWVVNFAQELGGSNGLLRITSQLEEVGQFMPDGIQGINPKTGRYDFDFDFSYYRTSKELYILRLTSGFGWLIRQFNREDVSEYFVFDRLIQQSRAKLIFFHDILRQINQLLQQLQIECVISVRGINTLSNLDRVEADLYTSKINFNDVYDRSRIFYCAPQHPGQTVPK